MAENIENDKLVSELISTFEVIVIPKGRTGDGLTTMLPKGEWHLSMNVGRWIVVAVNCGQWTFRRWIVVGEFSESVK